MRRALLFVLLLSLALPPMLRAARSRGPAPLEPVAMLNGVPRSGDWDALRRLPAVPTGLRSAMMAREYEKALGELDKLEEASPSELDTWRYLRGLALAYAERYDEAEDVLQRAEQEFPQSLWRYKMRFTRAEVLGQLDRYEEAEDILETEARRLRGTDRQEELASVYVGFADELSTPREGPESDQGLDYEKAWILYSKAIELDLGEVMRARTRYRMGHCRQGLGDWNSARSEWSQWIVDHGTDPGDILSEQDPMADVEVVRTLEVRSRLAEALLQLNQLADARRVLEDLRAKLEPVASRVIRPYSGTEEAYIKTIGTAMRLVAETTLQLDRTYGTRSGDGERAIAELERFLEFNDAHTLAFRAAFRIAERRQALGQVDDAIAAYRAFLQRLKTAGGDPDLAEEHEKLRMRALYLIGDLQMTAKRFAEAKATYREYVATHATGPDWTAAQRGIVQADYAVGESLRNQEQWQAARESWLAFLDTYPLDQRAPAILFALGEMHRERARAEEEAKTEVALDEIYRAAIIDWRRLAAKFPGTQEASHALYAIGEVYENELGELQNAIAAYRECTFGGHAGNARGSLQRMTQPSLTLLTERTWRSNEAPKISVQTRNLEDLEVRLYRLDLEAYYRKHLTHTRVEDLDLDLIAPDEVIERKVGDYRPHAPIEESIELPLEGPGVWAVSVSSEDLRATTLLVRSDVDVIVKSSRREVLVFAQDRVAEAGAEGVRVLLGLPGQGEGGNALVHEAVTGEDGVARIRLPELANTQDLRVLCEREGHYASDSLSLSGLGVAQGLQDRGYIYTDRPIYRPGEEVQWRAILREVRDQSYAFSEGDPIEVELFDSNGRSIHRDELPLSDFGTLHGAVQLDGAAAAGQYTLRCQSIDGPQFVGYFNVEEFRLRKVELNFDLERRLFFRGETVPIVVSASYYYGEPVANAPLNLTLPDGRVLNLRTDGQGIARTTFETRDLASEGAYSLRAQLPEEGVGTADGFRLVTQGFDTVVSTARDVLLAGETFAVDVRTTAPDGTPVGRPMVLEIFRRQVDSKGRWADVRVARHPVETEEKSGIASVAASLVEGELGLDGTPIVGGTYVLRASGTDQFGHPVQSDRVVYLSGTQDQQRLRILADDLRLEVGESVGVQLMNRAGAGLALLTFEGEEILEYRILRLTEGQNAVEIQVDHSHFPNFTLAAASMRSQVLHQASVDFQVARRLEVTLTPTQETYGPGDEAEVLVEARDQLGRPVEAELSLAVIDDALYEQFPDRAPAIRDYFEQGTQRQSEMRTSSSCVFSYTGATTSIAASVLEERERNLELARWKEGRDRTLETLSALGYVDADEKPAFAFDALSELTLPGEDPVLEDEFYSMDFNDVIGIGGGAGGRFGGRRAARKRGESPGPEDGSSARDDNGARAFWTANLRTDPEGRATVRFTFPEQSTRWRLTGRGVGRDTLVGDAFATMVTRSEIFLELRTPAVLVEGDRPVIRGRIHNGTGLTGAAQVRLRVGPEGRRRVLPVTVELGEQAVVDLTFPQLDALTEVGSLPIEAEMIAQLGEQDLVDSVSRSLQVRPFGLELFDSKSGVVGSRADFTLELAGDGEIAHRTLELIVGSGVDRLLVDSALGLGGGTRMGVRAPSASSSAAGALLGTSTVLQWLESSEHLEVPEYARLRERARGLVSSLVATQGPDGGWSWAQARGTSNPEVSGLAMIALAQARRAGIEVQGDTLAKGQSFLSTAFRDSGQQAEELKALYVYALSLHGRHDFAAANRLHRSRNSLSPAALAYSALALCEMGRAPMAVDLATLIDEAAVEFGGPGEARACRWPTAENVAWSREPQAMGALALLALQTALPKSERIEPAVQGLLAQRPWGAAHSRGWILAALAQYQGSTRPAQREMRVEVDIAGVVEHTLDLTGSSPGERLVIELDEELGLGAQVPVSLEVNGRGAPDFVAVLRGFSRSIDPRDHPRFEIRRSMYSAAYPRYRGRELSVGFGVIEGSFSGWHNAVTELPFAEELIADVSFTTLRDRDNLQNSSAEYLILEVPLPSGATLLEGSLQGDAQSHRVRDGVLEVQVGAHQGFGQVQFRLIGTYPGEYKVLPPALRSAYDPGALALGSETTLEVLDRGVESSDAYRPTPSELYYLGKAQYDSEDYGSAHGNLEALLTGYGDRLRDSILSDAARMMFFMGIERGDARGIVHHFEILKEKNPSMTIPFAEVVAVGEAYRELEEWERASIIFRATIEETFGKDLKVAGALEGLEDFARASDTLDRLCLEYPDIPMVVESWLTLSDKLLAKAPSASQDKSLDRAERNRAVLTVEGILLLQRFLTLYPEDPLAPDAGLNLVSAHLALEDYEKTADLAGEMAGHYGQPRFKDAFQYTRAIAEWYMGQEDSALELLDAIAAASYPDERGRMIPSENRDLALYILGQIHHARREAKKAAEYYGRVAHVFADAREALDNFRAKSISLPEVSEVAPGSPASLEITSRNVLQAELQVYAVDLMTLYLREKNLSSITSVNLAGIEPTLSKSVELGDGWDLRPRETAIDLGLEEPGAYLVICRGDELFTSGLILVSDLELEVYEDVQGGRLRIQALDRGDGAYLRDVDVRVVGSRDGRFESGTTDPRGLFVADGILGEATVIAQIDRKHYAFHRGSQVLGIQDKQPTESRRVEPMRGATSEDPSYFDNVLRFNASNQFERQQRLDQNIRADRGGVQIQQVR